MEKEVSVLIPAHNEEKTLNFCLKSIFNQVGIKEIILVADRCTDNTIAIAKKHNIRVLEKNFKKWLNPRAEVINFGIDELEGTYAFLCDADLYLTKNFMRHMIKSIKNPKTGVVSGTCITKGIFGIPNYQTFLGGCRLIRTRLLKEVRCKDLIGFDTYQDLLIEKKGFEVIANKKAIAYEMRPFRSKKYINQGIRKGWARYQLCFPFIFTILHLLFKFITNPFTLPEIISTLIGYVEGRIINLPRFKEARKIIVRRQKNRIRNFISKGLL
ncbi:MAG: glycosyltransferase family 2 protein [Candidatus Helarchaeota archaeon]|nr:glycosyltransferase family 2 protein [Candidatus Helarchaeota archaeon]